MDEGMESSASTSGAFGMRVFNAGDFHVGFGIAVPSDDETTEFTVESMTRNGRTPFRHSLAVTLYSDSLRQHALLGPESEDAFTLLSTLIGSEAGSRHRTAAAAKRRDAQAEIGGKVIAPRARNHGFGRRWWK
jgi:hypothetical protein